MRNIIIAVCCLTTGVWAARGDIIIPQKSVRHVVRLENLVDCSNYVFYVRPAPTRYAGKNPPLPVTEDGVTVSRFNRLALADGELRLYAVPKVRLGSPPRVPDDAWFTNSSSGIPQCALPVAPIKTLPEHDPANVIEHIFRVKISRDKLVLTVVRAERRASITTVQMTLLLLAVPAMFILFRRARARSSMMADPKPGRP